MTWAARETHYTEMQISPGLVAYYRSGGTRDLRRAYRVVDDFEAELAEYTGAPFAVATDSCTNAIMLALEWEKLRFQGEWLTGLRAGKFFGDDGEPTSPLPKIRLPKRTYVGVLQAVRNANFRGVEWSDDPWVYRYRLEPTAVVDSARRIAQGMYVSGTLTCLSFHAAKQLPLGRGGAILTDKAEAADWFRAARMDGRPPGAPIEQTLERGWHCPMDQQHAALGLAILSRWNDADYTPPPLPPQEYPDLSVLT